MSTKKQRDRIGRPSAIEEITDTQRTIARNALERKALREGYMALESTGPEAAIKVLAAYAPAIERLARP